MVEIKMLSTDRTSVKSWWKYQNIWHRLLRRKTFYFKSEADNFAYWIDRKGNLHLIQFENPNPNN